ncbi:MAG: acyltransferase 3 [Glaciihabitans sp.]|nr:acyltransferase 3 [Glaciihabitans sp.]
MATQTGATVSSATPGRILGLDGIRGLAALYVVLYHIFLRAWPGAAATHAPFWAVWLDNGRAAVIVFIALSGFSLAIGPARSGWRFSSIRDYARRRAWRILPPYWAALGFSLVMVWFVLAQPGWAVPDGKSVVVYGLLVQDAVSTGIPNRAFWSIAIEAQLYILLPLLLLIVRRFSAVAMVALVAAIVVPMGLLGPDVAWMNDALVKFTPDLAVLFAVGVLAAGIVTASERTRALPWAWFALAAVVPVIVLIWINGTAWSNANLFWVDLASAPAIGCLLAAVATSRPRIVIRFLNARPLRSLGSFSYSLYLTHLPIVIAVAYGLVLPRVPSGTATFFVLVAILVPTTILFARLFAAVFELPFQRHRVSNALRAIAQGPRQLTNPPDELPPNSARYDAAIATSQSPTRRCPTAAGPETWGG